jgi:uncharacterized repeat protein (TIGR03833 family)
MRKSDLSQGSNTGAGITRKIEGRKTRIMGAGGTGQQRGLIRVGQTVDIIRKEDQRSGKKTRGIVEEILTNSLFHPHGIKVRLKGGQVGRVAAVLPGPEENGH